MPLTDDERTWLRDEWRTERAIAEWRRPLRDAILKRQRLARAEVAS